MLHRYSFGERRPNETLCAVLGVSVLAGITLQRMMPTVVLVRIGVQECGYTMAVGCIRSGAGYSEAGYMMLLLLLALTLLVGRASLTCVAWPCELCVWLARLVSFATRLWSLAITLLFLFW